MVPRFGVNGGSVVVAAKGRRARPCPPDKVRVLKGMDMFGDWGRDVLF